MFDFCVEIPEPGTRVLVLFLRQHWVEGVVISIDEVDGQREALVEVDPDALKNWEVMADLGGPLKLVRPLRLRIPREDMRLAFAA
jgi:hypothetical protein